MAFNFLKQALHLPVAITQKHNIVGVSEVRNVDARTNLNPWVALQSSTKNPVDNLVEEGRRECTCLSDAEAFLKRQ